MVTPAEPRSLMSAMALYIIRCRVVGFVDPAFGDSAVMLDALSTSPEASLRLASCISSDTDA
ncbi:hypothetical protein GCM10011410_08720 [Hoyosella rhizosphaerae]|uniref:Uncharacterized protein n=1 Tax=Hoyosella rhizosphaerae TaxID=1755582 RepID=A0A916U5L8_9ACTN|nr:hypothetical protein GCM10011410_08720 [Hoyosella rhizosphaerae]